MIVLALLLMACAAVAAASRLVLRLVLRDPTVVVAALTALFLAIAAVIAANADTAHGWRRGAAMVLGVLVAVTGGSDVVRATFRLMRGEFVSRRPGLADPRLPTSSASPGPTDVPGPDVTPAASVLRGGAWIGFLERAAICATLLASWPEGTALVLAIKGVGRYPELRGAQSVEAHASEAFIIGTLVSVLWAAASAGTAFLLLR